VWHRTIGGCGCGSEGIYAVWFLIAMDRGERVLKELAGGNGKESQTVE
jgi:hypothetical protein